MEMIYFIFTIQYSCHASQYSVEIIIQPLEGTRKFLFQNGLENLGHLGLNFITELKQ